MAEAWQAGPASTIGVSRAALSQIRCQTAPKNSLQSSPTPLDVRSSGKPGKALRESRDMRRKITGHATLSFRQTKTGDSFVYQRRCSANGERMISVPSLPKLHSRGPAIYDNGDPPPNGGRRLVTHNSPVVCSVTSCKRRGEFNCLARRDR